MITNTDIWVIRQLFERIENEEIDANDATKKLEEYINTYKENDKNIKE